ncbi:lipoprotein [Mycoplasma cottewii]|uniref:Lipoprotein n=1 Tax=Mycoplasma cottewii TaxID=51364 RepID=A0ABY5TVV4_9MOLU|nr:lipoprotein [Mycoplasma cottewii]UWD34805.1 lipoprotein [Mycoplasma cottewii]
MKKLITLLSTFTFAATAMTGVVSCKKEEERTNSQFIKDNGEFDIDAKALLSWYKEWNGVNQDEGFINKFYNILAVGLLKGISEKGEFKLPTGKEAQERGWDESLNTELENLLGKKDGTTANSLYSFAHNALKDKRDNEFKDKHKDYIKFLEDKFKGVKRDQESLENAFLSDYILNDPSNSAFIRLKNTLMFNSTISNSLWRKGIQTNDLDINVIVKKFAGVDVYKNKNTLDDLAKAVKEAFSKEEGKMNWNDSSITSFTDLVNSVGGIEFGKDNISITYSSPEQIQKKIKDEQDKVDWIKTILKRFSNKDDSSNKGIIEFSNYVQSNNYDGSDKFVNFEGLRPQSWSKIVKQIPVLNGKDLKRDDIKGNFGSITDSQKFSIDNYFNTEKPVMVSDLIFNFANSKKKEDVEKQLTLEALIPISSSGTDLTKELVDRFQGIAATLQAYVNDDEKENDNDIPDTAGLSRFDTIFRGANRTIRADVNGGAKSFKDWTQWDKENTYHKINKTGDLLTISDTTFSNVAKYSVYDFITNQKDNKSNTFKWDGEAQLEKNDLIKYGINSGQADLIISALEGRDTTKTAIANVIKLFEKINQKALSEKDSDNNGKNMNKNMFTVLNKDNGIIAYIDGDGLHITKVDGYKLMNTQPSDKKEIDINKQTAVLKKIDSLYTSEFGKDLVPYLVNSMLKDAKPKVLLGESETAPAENAAVNQVADKVWDWSESDKKNSIAVSNMGVEIEHLNNNIKNNYERFLVNTSLIDNTKTKTFYNTNILNEASKSTDSSDKNLGSQASWLLGLFSKVFNNNEIINKIIKIPAEESVEPNNDKKLGADVKTEFDHLVTKVILDRQKMEKTASIGQFLSENQKWVKSILENWDAQSKGDINKEEFIPDQAIDLTSDNKKRFEALLNSDIFNPNQEVKSEKEER